uniref:Uncharacterized protein n=1 Tax=Candidatus Kentrum sp. TUN TaxID=2126343 RepID=A0A450ZN99_9GAMM|nr:MAG: hypothetical protein BECKTUN1418F_GA0071002_106510 [Candidatus Kentron sp. TUN]VFK61518.1 MAG: hypothetical protein BECKTUN1418E_GA0071001_10679 [Candidatus Kentron sp. TUN]
MPALRAETVKEVSLAPRMSSVRIFVFPIHQENARIIRNLLDMLLSIFATYIYKSL